MTRATVAGKVASDKLKHPERYCPVKDCLWCIDNGWTPPKPCPKHPLKTEGGAKS